MTVETILRNFFFIHSGNNALISALKSGGYAKTIQKNVSKSFSSKSLYTLFLISGLGVGATKLP